jgi:hypothetical protein
MSRLSWLPVVAVCAVALGCPSPQFVCRSGVNQVCQRVHECQTSAVKASPQFIAAFGTDAENCEDLLSQNPALPLGGQGVSCEDIRSEQELCANLGQPNFSRFDTLVAQQCKEDRSNLSCADYLAQLQDATSAPESCRRRCY